MRYWLLFPLLSLACVTTDRPVRVSEPCPEPPVLVPVFTPAVDLRQPTVTFCVTDPEGGTMLCMTPEEAQIRAALSE